MSGVFVSKGPRYGDGIFGSTRFSTESQVVTVVGNQSVGQDPANAYLLKTGSIVSATGAIPASGSGVATVVLVATGATAVGILAQDVDTSFGNQVADMYVTGDYNSAKLLVAAGDTVQAHMVQLNALNIYAEAPITCVTAGTD